MSFKDDQLVFCSFECKKNYSKDFNKELIKRFGSTYEFCDKDSNKFILLLRKGICPYEYMDSGKKFNEASLPNKEDFHISLNMESIADVDYRHAKKVSRDLNN